MQEPRITNLACETPHQQFMVDTGKKSDNIGLQGPVKTPHKMLSSLYGTVGPPAPPTRITVKDEPLLVERFKDVDNGMMHNAVSERSCTNLPRLRFTDVKMTIGTGSPQARFQFPLKRQQPWFPIEGKFGSIRTISLASSAALPRPNKMLPVMYSGKEIFPCFRQ